MDYLHLGEKRIEKCIQNTITHTYRIITRYPEKQETINLYIELSQNKKRKLHKNY